MLEGLDDMFADDDEVGEAVIDGAVGDELYVEVAEKGVANIATGEVAGGGIIEM